MLSNHEVHTLSRLERKASRISSQWLERRAAMKALRQTEFQRIFVRNNQIREQETDSASLVQKALNTRKWAA